MHTRASEIAGWLGERVTEAGARGLVVGLSGGIDSAVVAGLCQLAVPDRVVGVILPCHGDLQDEVDARLVADHLRLPTVRIDLAPAFDALTTGLKAAAAQLPSLLPGDREDADAAARTALANVKPRLRMTSLYYLANSLNYLVAGTGNGCELTIGYFTKYGDGGVDVLPIGGLLKSDVRALALDLGIPDTVIDKAPSAGLWPGQTDEGEMGFSYAELERYLRDGPEGVSPALALRVERMMRRSDHKRATPPMPQPAPR